MMRFSIKKYVSGLGRNVFLITLASFFSDIASEMLYPPFPDFYNRNT